MQLLLGVLPVRIGLGVSTLGMSHEVEQVSKKDMVEGSIEDNGKRAVCCLSGIIKFDMRAPNGTRKSDKTQHENADVDISCTRCRSVPNLILDTLSTTAAGMELGLSLL